MCTGPMWADTRAARRLRRRLRRIRTRPCPDSRRRRWAGCRGANPGSRRSTRTPCNRQRRRCRCSRSAENAALPAVLFPPTPSPPAGRPDSGPHQHPQRGTGRTGYQNAPSPATQPQAQSQRGTGRTGYQNAPSPATQPQAQSQRSPTGNQNMWPPGVLCGNAAAC